MPIPENAGQVLLPLARSAIAKKLKLPPVAVGEAAWLDEKAASFVTLTIGGELRGCIGSLVAHRTLRDDVTANAAAAAFGDPRFEPLTVSEYPAIRVEVSVLSTPEPVSGPAELDPRRYGVIVQAARGWRRGLLLPDLEGIDTVEEQIRICRYKAGIGLEEEAKRLGERVKA